MSNRIIVSITIIVLLCLLALPPCSTQAQSLDDDKAGMRSLFSSVDEAALSIPESLTRTPHDLAMYFQSISDSDSGRVRAAYTWITGNVRYELQEHGDSLNSWVFDPNEVLRIRKTVCEGYCVLFESICSEMGIHTQRVHGYLKGMGGNICDQPDGNGNHAWSAVMISGKWHLLDCTQSAEFAVAGQQVSPYSKEFYLLTPPSQLIYSHFPYNDYWQLLDDKLTLADFERLPHVTPVFFELGLGLPRSVSCNCTANDSLVLSVTAPDDVVVAAQLKTGEIEVEGRMTFEQRDNGNYVIQARFPEPGDFRLDIYGRLKSNSDGILHHAATILVSVQTVSRINDEFPMIYRPYRDVEAYLYTPMVSTIRAGQMETFRIKAPTAQEVYVVCGDDWTQLSRNGDLFEGNVVVGSGGADIAAKFPGQPHYETLVHFDTE